MYTYSCSLAVCLSASAAATSGFRMTISVEAELSGDILYVDLQLYVFQLEAIICPMYVSRLSVCLQELLLSE